MVVASRSLPDSRYVFSPKNFRYLYTRHLASRVLSFLIQKLFIPKVKDTQAGQKGFHRSVAKFLFGQLKLRGFSFDLELLHVAFRAGISFKEIPIDFYAQRVSTVNFPLESYRMLRDIACILIWTAQGKYQFTYSAEKLPAVRVS
jgi:dolichyl-phosphate beta-glucosyltransferase